MSKTISRHCIFRLCLVGLLLLTAACVSIPAQTWLVSQITTTSIETADQPVSAECTIKNIQAALVSPTTSPLQLDPQKISVINWNIYKAQEDGWAADFKSFIETQNLVLIQEAVNRQEIINLLEAQQPYWLLNTGFYYEGSEAGVLIASSVPAIFNCGLRITEPIIRVPKTVLISLYPLADSNKKLLVANIHGINFTLGTDTYDQQITAMVSIIEQHKGPVIIAGDFNSWSESRLAIVNAMVEKLVLKKLAYASQNRVRIFGNALDHVFYRGLEIITEETLKVTSSDHNPIKVSFRLLE